MSTETKTINITPTWGGLVYHMMLVLETTEDPSVRADMQAEFRRMAQAADKYNEMQANNAEAIAKVTG